MNTDGPEQDSRESVGPEQTPGPEGNFTAGQPAVVPHIPPAPANSPQAQNAGQDNTPPWKKRLEVIAAIIGAGLLIVNIFQMRATQQAVDVSREALESVQRAFITFTGIQSEPVHPTEGVTIPGIDKELNGHVFVAAWENTGETPATNVMSYFTIDLVSNSNAPSFPFTTHDRDQFTPTTFGPKAKINSGPLAMPEGFWTQEKQGNTFYFWGWKIYRDVFSHTPIHVTEFCVNLAHVVKNIPFGANPDNVPFSFQYGDCNGRHNCTDKDCSDYNTLVELAKSQQRIK